MTNPSTCSDPSNRTNNRTPIEVAIVIELRPHDRGGNCTYRRTNRSVVTIGIVVLLRGTTCNQC